MVVRWLSKRQVLDAVSVGDNDPAEHNLTTDREESI